MWSNIKSSAGQTVLYTSQYEQGALLTAAGGTSYLRVQHYLVVSGPISLYYSHSCFYTLPVTLFTSVLSKPKTIHGRFTRRTNQLFFDVHVLLHVHYNVRKQAATSSAVNPLVIFLRHPGQWLATSIPHIALLWCISLNQQQRNPDQQHHIASW